MSVFIALFIVFTISNTFFHNINISIITLGILFMIITIFHIFEYRKRFGKYLKYTLILFGSFILSSSALLIKDWRYNTETLESFFQTKVSSPMIAITGSLSYYIGTGNIIDTYSYGKYIFQTFIGKEYILNTDKNYQIGDKLRLVGYIKDTKLILYKDSLSGFLNFSGLSFDYDKRLIMKGYRGNIYEQNSVIIKEYGQSYFMDFSGQVSTSHGVLRGYIETTNSDLIPQSQTNFIQNIKRSLQSQIISTYGVGRTAGLILGMLIGDKSQIPKSDYQTFIDSGLVHLIAVSGGNIIMLTVFLSFVLFFLPFYLRNFIILLLIVLYSLVCGMDSSVMRAVLFGGLGMMALFVGRENNFRRSVSIVFIVMLLINPYFLLYDLGFLLSFGAILGIKIFNKKKEIEEKKLDSEHKKTMPELLGIILKRIYFSYIKPSIGANIGIFPIIIFFMGKINLVGFITNLFVLPIIPFVMIYGFISIFLYRLFPRSGFVYIQEQLINYIYKVSEIGGDYGIYLLVLDYRMKYLILILFIIGLIIYMVKNNIIYTKNLDKQK